MAVKSYRVCWTDLHIYNGDYDARMPVVTGHETSRIVDKIGANLIEFKIGNKVTAGTVIIPYYSTESTVKQHSIPHPTNLYS